LSGVAAHRASLFGETRSVVDWGRELEDSFSLIVFLTVPADIRVARLRVRERRCPVMRIDGEVARLPAAPPDRGAVPSTPSQITSTLRSASDRRMSGGNTVTR
jgi:hypothetical protein